MRVLVVGAGTGSRSAAAVLRQRAHDIDIIEVNPNCSVYGVGITQPANNPRALRSFGFLDETAGTRYQWGFYGSQGEIAAEHHDVRDGVFSIDEAVSSPISDVLLPPSWFSGQVGSLGDASHACAPHLTQGASMAQERLSENPKILIFT